MDQNTINIDVEIIYFWFDNNNILSQNGDDQLVNKAIEEGDYETFMKFYNYYNNEYKYDSKGGAVIFFPNEAALFYRDECIGQINIIEPLGFSMITSYSQECGD